MTQNSSFIKSGSAELQAPLQKRYGAQAGKIQFVEAFEISEYGEQPNEEEIRRLFPFFPAI
jgi:hypothetical protein